MLYEMVLALHLALVQPLVLGASSRLLAEHEFSLNNRYDNEFVNGVFKDNILLTLHYLANPELTRDQINWDKVRQPVTVSFSLEPGKVFAFHDNSLPQYAPNVVKTTNAHFIGEEGFRNSGYLIGDGVCHLASLMYWAAVDAGLEAEAPSNHNFRLINEVPKEYGVGILSPMPLGNLYIVNSRENPVSFTFDFDGETLTVGVYENNKLAS